MAYFSDEQMLQILSATNAPNLELIRLDPNNNALGRQSDIDAKYGTGASSKPPIAAPTRQPNYPDQITMTGEPGYQFNCPVPGAGDCLARVPREDITIQAQLNSTAEDVTIDLDNVRGMRLCSIDGLVTFGTTGSDEPVSETEIKMFLRALNFAGTFTLNFRGQAVPEYQDIPIGAISPGLDCCENEKLCIDCVVPRDGGMSISTNLFSEIDQPDWVSDFVFVTRLKFSGCGCNCSNKSSCGCG